MQSRISKNCRAPSRVMYFLFHWSYLYVRIKSSNIWFDTEAPPPPPHPFVYHFWKRRYTFCTPSIEKWFTLHIPSREIYIPFNCCKCTVYLNKPQNQNGVFSTFSQPQNAPASPFGTLQTEMTNFPTLSYISTIEFPALFIYLEIENAAFPRTGNYTPRAFTQALDILVFYF